jgi:putative intracellular protease/amidase
MTTTATNTADDTHRSGPLERSPLAVAILATGEGDATPYVPKALHATTIDVLSPAGAALTDRRRTSTIAFGSAHVEDYALVLIPDGRAGAQLQDNPDAVEFLNAFARSGTAPGAEQAGPHLMIDVGVNAMGVTTAWQEVGPDIRDVSGTAGQAAIGRPWTELPHHLVRINARIFEQVIFTTSRVT